MLAETEIPLWDWLRPVVPTVALLARGTVTTVCSEKLFRLAFAASPNLDFISVPSSVSLRCQLRGPIHLRQLRQLSFVSD